VTTTDAASIDSLFEKFLGEQHKRVKDKTFGRYVMIIDLFRGYLNSYGHLDLDDADQHRFQAAFDHDEDAFCALFGADQILDGLGEFLNYYMIRKVMASKDDLAAASTVTRKLVKWLRENQLINSTDSAVGMDQASAAKALPDLDRLTEIFYDLSQALSLGDVRKLPAVGEADVIQDQLWISHVEPQKIYFDGVEGFLAVPEEASSLAEVGWSVNIVLARLAGHWRVVEAGNVYPY